MKLTFERETVEEIVADIYAFVNNIVSMREALPLQEQPPKFEAPPPDVPSPAVTVETKPAEVKPKNKGGRPKGYSPKKNGAAVAAKTDAHKNVADKAKARAEKEAKAVPAGRDKPTSSDEMVSEVNFEDLELPAPAPEPEQLTPVQLAAIRVKTTQELQYAHANGKHVQVMALLKKYGNGATSFREMHVEDFVPIRKAIDEGALA